MATFSFTADRISGPSPLYVRLTDSSSVSDLTSATDYQRIWSFFNNATSAISYEITTSASINKSLTGILGSTFTVSLSAII